MAGSGGKEIVRVEGRGEGIAVVKEAVGFGQYDSI